MSVSTLSVIANCLGPFSSLSHPNFVVPALACDTHAHVIAEDTARYPFTSNRSYTPPPAPEKAYLAMLDALGIQRGVLVQPSIYGTDNRYMREVLARHTDRLRGVAVIDAQVSTAELEQMHTEGVRGVRINALFRGGVALDSMEQIAARIAPFGWHMQFLIDVTHGVELLPRIARLGCEVVIDHMGYLTPSTHISDALKALEKYVAEKGWWVKLSGAYRLVRKLEDMRQVTPIAQALIRANPHRMVWGSDWPHVAVHEMPNTTDLLSMLAEWAPDDMIRQHILVQNPEMLYGFTS
ncbi:amidohydrolase family protein [Acetobacter pasteurianus]|uniref:amidohydrolase family protein n=1 Tax=Acetobacter pasteurianus TaxID=438 RepID=UPI003D103E07